MENNSVNRVFFQNLSELSNDERESIIRVLKRDAELNDLESERVFRLKRILKDFKRRGIGKGRPGRVSVNLYDPNSMVYRMDSISYRSYDMDNIYFSLHLALEKNLAQEQIKNYYELINL